MLFQLTGGTKLKESAKVLQKWGVIDLFLPFLLIFSILFVILQQTKIFKDGDKANRKVNGIIALLLSLAVTIPHVLGKYPANMDPINIINKILPGTIVIILAILLLMILLGLITHQRPTLIQGLAGFIGVLILIGIVIINVFPALNVRNLGPLNDPSVQALLVILLAFGITVYFIVHEKSTKKKGFIHEWMYKKPGQAATGQPPPQRPPGTT